MFTPKLTSVRTRLPSSAVSDRTFTGNRSSALFTPKNKPHTPLTGLSSRLNATEFGSRSVLENVTEHMLVEYGLPVPVLVSESLASKKTHATAKLDRNGWAWFVSGTKLVIWNYKPMQFIKAGQCFELSLPSCRVPHSACLAAVFSTRQSAAPGCIAVAPDGAVRYWSNVTLDTSYMEIGMADIRDDLCQELVTVQIGSCVVGTSSGALYVISASSQGRVACRPLRPAQGMLSGLGRRVSSIFFTPTPSQSSPLRRLLPGEVIADDTQAVYVLTDDYLQKWSLKLDSDKLLYQINIGDLFSENLAVALWKQSSDKLPNMNSWILDMQLIRDGLAIFGAGANTDVSLEVRYVLGTLHTEGDELPNSFISFTPISHITVYEEIENWMPSYKMMIPSLSSSFIYLYDSSYILCVSATHPELTPETVEFSNLGCGCSDDLALFISHDGELVTVKDISDDDMSTTNMASKTASFQQLDTSLATNVTVERIDELSQSGSDLERLKAAFLASIQDPMSQLRAHSIVDELFPPGMASNIETGSSLDSLVATLSREMIDDYPASDPRWAESLPTGVAPASVSLILIHQLEDKLKAHELYLRFLKTVNIWTRLTTVRARDDAVMATNMLLCEHAEKLEAVKALHDFHIEHAILVNDAIDRVLMQRRSDVHRGLTASDLFYREVSRVQEIFDCLVSCEEEYLAVEVATYEVFSRIVTVNAIIIGLLSAAIKYRQSASQIYQVVNSTPSCLPPEFVPWTASAAIRSVICRQHELTVQRCGSGVPSPQDKAVIFQQLVELTDIILDGYRVQLNSIKMLKHSVVGSSETDRYLELLRKYEQERTTLIAPFMKHDEFEKAASLAEKYCDFATLVELCERLNNQERLRRYMDQFQHKGFSDFVFKWYMDVGKRGKLMASDLSSHPLLANFLDSKENKFMSWLHDIQYNDYYQAHKTLVTLAEDEHEYVTKKKTLLSLSKLTALACDDIPDDILTNIQAINDEQDLLLHQEQLPLELVESFGMDPKTMPVLTARKLIEMYISDYNAHSTECDFKKALDLLYYFAKDEPDRDDLVLEIWCRAILKDEWNHISKVDPVESCRDSVFYRTLELLVTMAENSAIGDLLPTAEGLFNCDLLGDIRNREDFRFLIQAALEHIQRLAAVTDME